MVALEHAQAMAAHESPRTTKLYDRTKERLTLDEIERITTLDFDPAPQTLTTERAGFDTMLNAHQVRRIFIRVGVPAVPAADRGHWGGRLFYRRMRAARHGLRESSARCACRRLCPTGSRTSCPSC